MNYGTLVKSVSNGNWTNVSTWQARRVPQPTDEVMIDATHTVTLPGNLDLKCKSLMLNPNSNLVIPATSKLTVKGN